MSTATEKRDAIERQIRKEIAIERLAGTVAGVLVTLVIQRIHRSRR